MLLWYTHQHAIGLPLGKSKAHVPWLWKCVHIRYQQAVNLGISPCSLVFYHRSEGKLLQYPIPMMHHDSAPGEQAHLLMIHSSEGLQVPAL